MYRKQEPEIYFLLVFDGHGSVTPGSEIYLLINYKRINSLVFFPQTQNENVHTCHSNDLALPFQEWQKRLRAYKWLPQHALLCPRDLLNPHEFALLIHLSPGRIGWCFTKLTWKTHASLQGKDQLPWKGLISRRSPMASFVYSSLKCFEVLWFCGNLGDSQMSWWPSALLTSDLTNTVQPG